MNPPRLSRRELLAGAALSTRALGAAERYPRNLTKQDIERWMNELSNWGKWGKDDQAGAVNLITAAKRKSAAALVREGVSISMSLDADLPREGGRSTWTFATRPPGPDPRPEPAYVVETVGVSYHGNNTTHIDVPSHMYYKGQLYNGYPQTVYTDRGAGRNDVMPLKNGILTRGVLFDIPLLNGVPYLDDRQAIYPEDLEAWEKKAGFHVESGDAVLVRTGRWRRVREKGPLNLNQAAPGLYASCTKWLRERGAAILGSDAVQDVRPSQIEGVNQPVHQLSLVAMGMPLIDNASLEELAEAAEKRKRWTYMLTINPLRVPGATGSAVNPIATF